MKITIHPEIFELFPDLIFGAVKVEDINNQGQDSGITSLLREAENNLQIPEPITEFPSIAIWREAYRKFGAKPKKYPSSVEALCRRVLKGNPIPQINKLVDIYNAMCVKYIVPVGAEDLDKIQGDFLLTRANGTEKSLVWGDEEEKLCEKGEVIYRDDIGPICRRFNWREVKRSAISEDTKNALIVTESLLPNSKSTMEEILQELEELVKKYCGGKTKIFMLDKNNPSCELSPS